MTRTGKLNLNVVPKQNIIHCTDMRLENIVLTYKDGSKKTFNPIGLGVNWNGYGLPSKDFDLYEDSSYDLKCTLKAQDNPATHINADLVVDTTSDKNMIYAHVDSDIIPKR